MERNIKIAIMGAHGLAPSTSPDINPRPWPPAGRDWPACLHELKENSITHLLLAPPFTPDQAQIAAYFRHTPWPLEDNPGALLPRLQDEFENSRQGAANLQLLVFTDFSVLEQARPVNYGQAGLCHARQKEQPAIPLAVNRWTGARWRGSLCWQRLRCWGALPAEQRRLELNIVSQIAVMLSSLGFLAAWTAGWDTMGWLLVLLLYPMNRPYIRLVADKHPNLVPACLGYCLLRPFAWLAGLLGKVRAE